MANNMQMITELLDAPIAFNPAFAKVVDNNLAAGMLLSQLFYWAKTKNFGEFYKLNEELQQECFLGRTEFETARKKILSTGIFNLIKRGIPCKIYYQINLEVLIDLLNKLVCRKPAIQNAENLQTEMQEPSKLECMEPANSDAESQQTLIYNREYTETTTENNPIPLEGVLEENPKMKFVKNETQQTVANNSQAEYGGDANKAQKTSKVRKPTAPLPEFNYDGFDEADKVSIEMWFGYCKEMKKSYKSQSSLTELHRYFLELKASNILAGAIKYSIRSQYQAVFVPHVAKNNHNQPKKHFNEVHDYTANKPVNQVDRF